MNEDRLWLLRQEISDRIQSYADILYAPTSFIPGKTIIPSSGKLLDAEELKLMVEASLDGWLTTGRFNSEFERSLAKFLGVRTAITVNSGSSANLVAFMALTSSTLGDAAIAPGDEIITVAAGFPTTINPIIQFGAIPVFVDIELGSYNINPSLILEAVSPRTKGIILAHTLGNPFDISSVTAICEKHNLWLIEDCCDALGSTYAGKHVGSFGDLATLSFYPAHQITMGEGGAVFTQSPKLKRIAESIRDWGRDCFCPPGTDNTCGTRFCKKLGGLPIGYDHKYTYSHLGYNLKITDVQAACGVGQLRKLNNFIDKRKLNFKYLMDRFDSYEDRLILPVTTDNADPSWFGFPLTIRQNSSSQRLELVRFLDERKIGTRQLFAGNLTRQPYMKNVKYKISGALENTDKAMNDTFWVGVHPSLTEEMIDYTAESIRNFLDHKL